MNIINPDVYDQAEWRLDTNNSEAEVVREWTGRDEDGSLRTFALVAGTTRAEAFVQDINDQPVTLKVDLGWEEDEGHFRLTGCRSATPADVYVPDEDSFHTHLQNPVPPGEEESVLDERDSFNALVDFGVVCENVLDDIPSEDIVAAGEANLYQAVTRQAAPNELQPGAIITDLEGYDLGEDGAVVLDLSDETAELIRRDTKEILTVDLDEYEFQAEEPVHGEGLPHSWYDPDALDSPELHNIRWLPTRWGPRDPNYPSTLTDVSWRPVPYWRRWQNRYHSTQENQPVSYKNMIYRRRYAATPLPDMDPVPHVEPRGQHVQTEYGLPRRMKLERWQEDKDHALDTDTLMRLASEFWSQYRKKRYTLMPEVGSRESLELRDWGLMFKERLELRRAEMELLYDFMIDTDLVPPNEKDLFVDLLDTFQVYFTNHLK